MIQNIINRLVRDFPILNSEEITNSLKEAIANDRIGGRNMFLILRCISNISYDKLGDLIRFYTKDTYFNGKSDNLLIAYNIINTSTPEIKISSVEIITKQLDEYEKIYGWNPDGKYLIPNNGYGLFAIMLINRLMKSPVMSTFISDKTQRYKYIIEKQIFTTDFDAKNNFIYIVLTNTGLNFNHNNYYGDFLSDSFTTYKQRTWNIDKFTAIFFEPPVKNVNKIGKTHSYIYHKWILKAEEHSNRINAITPGRWLQTNTSGLNYLIKFRDKIKNSGNLRVLNHTDDVSSDLLLNGGLAYFIIDKKYNDKCIINGSQVDLNKFDIIVTDTSITSIISKLQHHGSIIDRYIGLGSSWTGIKTNDNRLVDTPTCLKVHVSSRKNKNGFLYIDSSYLNTRIPISMNTYKVFTPETATRSGKGFAKKFIIGAPYEICTQSFCVFIAHTEEEAKSMVSYFKTNFATKLVGIRKIKNHINDFTLKWLPIVPFDRIWTDEQLFKWFKLNKKQQQFFYE
jgi:hypothetical protein